MLFYYRKFHNGVLSHNITFVFDADLHSGVFDVSFRSKREVWKHSIDRIEEHPLNFCVQEVSGRGDQKWSFSDGRLHRE